MMWLPNTRIGLFRLPLYSLWELTFRGRIALSTCLERNVSEKSSVHYHPKFSVGGCRS